jgi:hypothetical protein
MRSLGTEISLRVKAYVVLAEENRLPMSSVRK